MIWWKWVHNTFRFIILEQRQGFRFFQEDTISFPDRYVWRYSLHPRMTTFKSLLVFFFKFLLWFWFFNLGLHFGQLDKLFDKSYLFLRHGHQEHNLLESIYRFTSYTTLLLCHLHKYETCLRKYQNTQTSWIIFQNLSKQPKADADYHWRKYPWSY